MKDGNAKKLIKKSMIPTSEGFTDKLMEKLETESIAQQQSATLYIHFCRYAILGILGLAITLATLLYFNLLPKFKIAYISFPNGKIPLLIISIFLLLLGLNHVLTIYYTARLRREF